MKKTFESFINSQSLDLQKIEGYLNNKKMMNALEKVFSLVPESWLNKIANYAKTETINIDKIISFNKRFGVVEKTIKLYKSGVKNIKDIYDGIFQKNESVALLVFGIVLVVIGVALVLFAIIGIFASVREGELEENLGGIIVVIILGCIIFFFGRIAYLDDGKEENKPQKIEFYVEKDKKEHIIMVKIDTTGNYTIEEIEGDW